ncbi:hypothetical protein KUA23_18020 [Pseudomonas pergaminensis]|uniref:Uncharacterized protein n=1 Tax=Pseudomonas pergaminensis TaxID=2853159 RepID=A0ABD7TBA8_9PSED|nr:hypothetical protein [Pseudomonas pergaminensis]USV98959.1 hypothetical protein KUA23_18020 [Pseudomonas pergaminensis]
MPAIAVEQIENLPLTHRYRRQASSHIDRVNPEGFAQNIDPERYLPDSNRLKDLLQQLAAFKQVTATSPATREPFA